MAHGRRDCYTETRYLQGPMTGFSALCHSNGTPLLPVLDLACDNYHDRLDNRTSPNFLWEPFSVSKASIQLGNTFLSDFQSVSFFSVSPSPSSADNSGTSHDAAIGAGVGVPLGVISLASLGWAFFKRKRAQNAYAKMESMAVVANGGGATCCF